MIPVSAVQGNRTLPPSTDIYCSLSSKYTMVIMPPALLVLFMIITVGRILGSPTIKDVNHDELTLFAVGPADPTLEDHFGIVWHTSNSTLILS